MKNLKTRWKIYGLVYFAMVFVLVPSLASAYIDPSVTTYAIQAIVGVAVAAGAFFATYGRRMKKSWMRTLNIDENETRTAEVPLEVNREDLREELFRKREERKNQAVPGLKKKKNLKGRIITSLLCGFAVSLTIVFRPIISFYLSNENEFWFYLEEVIWNILVLSGGVAVLVFLIHFLLPDKGKVSWRMLFAAIVTAGIFSAFIQNHFMSSYLPVLTGEPVDWSQYANWGRASIVLWIGLFVLLVGGALIKARCFKSIIYGLLVLLICVETIAGGIDILTGERVSHEEEKIYFSRAGIFDTSEKGNVVILVSDTFEGTYMNELLETYPEVRELLPEITFYDNVTGIGSMTYLSYTNLLTGLDFPMGENEKSGIRTTFENEKLISLIYNNGWDVAYYSDFAPTENIKGMVLNCESGRLAPNRDACWDIAKHLWKSSLFQSAPQQFKDRFTVYSLEYDLIRSRMPETEQVKPYTEDDQWFYWTMVNNQAVNAVNAERPRYELVQLWGLHDPCELESDFSPTEFDESVSLHDRKLKAGRAMMQLIREYLDQLKEQGTYDQTTVIMTADHGFNLRYYPVLLVKEANTKQTEFCINNTPLSLKEDFTPLMVALTNGKSFSQAVADLHISPERVRIATDYRCTKGYSEVADKRTDITITGQAKEIDSYTYGNDEFTLNDHFLGRCKPGTSFIQGGEPNDTVAVYGISDGKAYGHTVVFDAFFDTEEERTLTLIIQLKNITKRNQNVRFRMDGETITEVLIPVAQDSDSYEEISIQLPKNTADRWTIYMDMPESVQRIEAEKVLPWVAFDSIKVSSAFFR